MARALGEWWPAAPLILFAAGMLALPLGKLILDAFAVDGGFGLDNVHEVLQNPVDQRAITNSLLLALVQASLAAAIGTPLTLLIARMRVARRDSWIALLTVTSNFGGIGLVFAFLLLIGGHGVLTLALSGVGIANPFPATNTFAGFNLVYLYTNVPLFVLLLLPAAGVLKSAWREAADTSHASRAQYWWRVGIPIFAPFVGANWLLIFTWTMGVFALPYALDAGPDSFQVLTLQIGRTLESSVFGLERAAVLSTFLALLATLSMLLYHWAKRRATRWL
jgi:putative spermidine/putrescine transport system permease protein